MFIPAGCLSLGKEGLPGRETFVGKLFLPGSRALKSSDPMGHQTAEYALFLSGIRTLKSSGPPGHESGEERLVLPGPRTLQSSDRRAMRPLREVYSCATRGL